MTKSEQENLKEIIQEPSKIYLEELMKKHTSFKIGGPAEVFIKIADIETLKKVLSFAKKYKIPVTILGNGSNVLVSDKGIKGITLQIEIQKLEEQTLRSEENEEEIITVGAGNKLSAVAYEMLNKSLSGMEELSGIPGTIGGAVYMNAGAHGKEIKDIVESITYLDENRNKKQMSSEQAEFSYRHSIFEEKDYIILEVMIKLQKGNKAQIEEKMKEYAEFRKEKQPLEYPNSGSTFKRGKDYITAQLIDECGLKGYTIGGAQVSTKHAGFIVNSSNATAKDVLDLAKYVQEKVYERFKKKIELEIKVIGERMI